jgi:hypothetical protein
VVVVVVILPLPPPENEKADEIADFPEETRESIESGRNI